MRWIKLFVAASLVVSAAAVAPVDASASAQTDFVSKLVKSAQENERRTGIPASVAIGMAALETGWGRSTMAGTYVVDKGLSTEKAYRVNTLFNIKCTSTPSPHQNGCVPVRTAEYTSSGARYYIVAKFRTYASWGDSILDYGRLLTSASRYRNAFAYTSYPDQFVTEVRKGGYATDPQYAAQVISIMKKYNLYRYNVSGAGPGYPNSVTPRPTPTPKPTVTPRPTPAPTAAFVSYSRGSRGAGVATLQKLLTAQGAGRLTADGIFGVATRNAVIAFQKRHGLTANGTSDTRTWTRLVPVLRSGARGEAVKALQVELRAAGYPIAVDGIFGKGTANALSAFQRSKKIPVTNQADALTWSRLIG